MSISSPTNYSNLGVNSPIPPRRSLNNDEKESEYYKTPSFQSLPSLSIKLYHPKKSQSTLGNHSQSEPMINRRLPKLTLSNKNIPASSIQQKRKLKRKMDRDNWRSNNNDQRKLRSSYYPDHSYELSQKYRSSFLDQESKTRCEDYAPGKRCGIIPVDIRMNSEGKKVISLLVVMGRPTILENGRAMNIWSFGKGRMIETESEENCAIREFWEETGIKIPTVNNLSRIELGKNVYFILHTTKETMPTEQLAIKDVLEVQDVAWKTIEELREIEKRVSPDQRVNKDVRAIIKYPVRSFYYHKLIFNPEIKHQVQDVRECSENSKTIKVGNFILRGRQAPSIPPE